jgi:general secretion pathway protein K
MSIHKARERGFAVLVVLWTLALVALLVAHVLANGRTELSIAANRSEAEDVQAIADGAVYQATFRVMAGEWTADGATRQLRVGAGNAEVQIEDLAGRINPNHVSRAVMQRLLVDIGARPEQADEIAMAMEDWRRSGNEAEPLGATAPQYLLARLGYVPTGQPFRNLQEIGLVLGMTPGLLAALAPHLSVFAPATPDPLRADPLVARALTAEDGAIIAAASQYEPREAEVVEITAAALAPSGVRFSRRAVIGLFPPGHGNPNPWRILAWQ